MSLLRKIQVIGLNHQAAPVDVRESLAFAGPRLHEALSLMRNAPEVEEAVILSTCNRVEIYLCMLDLEGENFVKDFLADFHGLKAEFFEEHLYRHEHQAAVTHLFRVVSGLDSMVLGESQITAQVKDAYGAACREGAAGRILHRLFQRSLAASKKARNCSEIASGRASVGSVAALFAERIFGTLSNRAALLVGAGKMGELVLRALCAAGADTTLVVNRTFARAEALARKYGGNAARFNQLAANLAHADIVICSTDAPHYIIRPDDVRRALDARRGKAIFLIDISAPRDVDPAVAEIEGAHLYNIDDLQVVVDETMSRRKQEADRCMAIVDSASREFMQWTRQLAP